MPRNGSDIYFIPPGTEGFPDTTIESAKYNTYIHDVETDLNKPRPISVGGTGANNAKDARINLDAEVASQRVINYDTHVFESGSFWSWSEATGAPIPNHGFTGTCVVIDNDNITLAARSFIADSLAPGRIYIREKLAGVWSAWTQDSTGIIGPTPPVDPPDGLLWWDNIGGHLYVWYNDGNSKQWVIASPFSDPAQFLLKAGDTMIGQLKLPNWPVVNEDAASAGWVNARIGDAVAAAAANVQPQLDGKVSKTGDTMSGPLTVNSNITASGSIAVSGDFAAGGGLNVQADIYGRDIYVRDIHATRPNAPGTGALFCGNGGAYLYYNGSNWNLQGGSTFVCSSNFQSVGTIYCNNGLFQSLTADMYLGGNGGNIALRPYGSTNQTNQVVIATNGNLHVTGNGSSFLPPNGTNGGFACKNGDSNYMAGDYFNFANNSGQLASYIGNAYMGNVTFQSDYRIKKDVQPLPSTWETVKSLNPIKYTQKNFGDFKADDIERWGFIAHELQETLVESAATGVKDQENCVQSPNPFTIIAALTKALQEAMERIEELETRV